MMVVRPARPEDLQEIMALADQSAFGLTNLPKDPQLLRERIQNSVGACKGLPEKGRQVSYLFVMVDLHDGRIVGTSGIISQVGIGEPFYAYRIETHVQQSQALGIRKELPCLHLEVIENGPCEIGGLFVHPAYQRHGHGRLISLSRFLFLAEHTDRFPSLVIAEMRGLIEEGGYCPFWEAMGRPFFDIDFPRADYLTMKDKRFIAELLPRHPVYVLLLPMEARAAIGQVHERTRPALKLLREEGFQDSGMIDIFDGGPLVQCNLQQIRTVKEAGLRTYLGSGEPTEPSKNLLVARGRLAEFRACLTTVTFDEGGVRLPVNAAKALELKEGETVRCTAVRRERRQDS